MRGLGLQQVVHGVAAHLFGAAGAPGLAVQADQAGFGWGLVAPATGNQDRPGNEGQLVVFLEEDYDAILQLDAFGLVGIELMQLGNGNLFPGFALLGR